MTIAISTKIGEGLVYAADSTSTLFETFDTASGPQTRLAQSFHHARKLIQLEEYPIGIMTYGLGHVAARNLESLVAEFEREELTPFNILMGADYTVEQLAAQLHGFLSGKYDAAYPPPAPGEPDGPPPPDTRAAMGVIARSGARGR